MKKMLLVFAHPDDESFTSGGVVQKYVANGYEVQLLCITHGEAGGSGPFEDITGDALGRIRTRELEKAAEILGISQVSFLDYKDGKLKELNPGELEDKIFRKLLEFAPDIVITFEPSGISNHPDHMMVTLSTTYAFQEYVGELTETRQFIKDFKEKKPNVKVRHFVSQHNVSLKEKSFAEVVETDLEPKLYYVCMPESVAHFLLNKKVLPKESFGKPWTGTPDKFVTTVIDVKKFRSGKIKALQAHKSQQDDVERFLSTGLSHPLLNQEFFILRMQGLQEIYMGKNDKVSNRL